MPRSSCHLSWVRSQARLFTAATESSGIRNIVSHLDRIVSMRLTMSEITCAILSILSSERSERLFNHLLRSDNQTPPQVRNG